MSRLAQPARAAAVSSSATTTLVAPFIVRYFFMPGVLLVG
jgi:hypothetical protein